MSVGSRAGRAVDGFKLVLPEAAQVVFGEAAVADEDGKDEREDGVAVVVFAVDLLAALVSQRSSSHSSDGS